MIAIPIRGLIAKPAHPATLQYACIVLKAGAVKVFIYLFYFKDFDRLSGTPGVIAIRVSDQRTPVIFRQRFLPHRVPS